MQASAHRKSTPSLSLFLITHLCLAHSAADTAGSRGAADGTKGGVQRLRRGGAALPASLQQEDGPSTVLKVGMVVGFGLMVETTGH